MNDAYIIARPAQNTDTVWTEGSLITPEPWTRDGACLTTDPDTFFPEAPGTRARRMEADARRVCASCPVIADCLAYALRNREDHGIWGGTNPKERAANPPAQGVEDMIEPKQPKQTATDERRARAAVKERDQGICVRCGRPGNNWDHRKNRSQGGRWEASNGQTLCGSGTTGCHGWRTLNPAAAVLEGYAVPGWGRPENWPAYRADIASWVIYLNAPDSFGRWWEEITEATADLLMNGGTP